MSLYKDIADGTYIPNSTSSSWQDRKEEETVLIDNLLAGFKDSKSCLKTKAETHFTLDTCARKKGGLVEMVKLCPHSD